MFTRSASRPPGSIEAYLKKVRLIVLRNDGIRFYWMVYSAVLLLVWVLLTAEAHLYLPPGYREAIFSALRVTILTGSVLLIVYLVAILLNLIPAYRISHLARITGDLAFSKKDTVINALQLERSDDQASSAELKQAFVSRTLDHLNSLSMNTIFAEKRTMKWKAAGIFLLILVSGTILLRWDEAGGAVYRWAHRDTEFHAPPPFKINSLSGDIHLLGGGSTAVEVEVSGAKPDTVWLELTTPGQKLESEDPPRILRATPDLQGHFIFTVSNIHQDYDYRAFIPARYFWEAWHEVTTPRYRIMVTDRPILQDFKITVLSPGYSGLGPVIQEENQASVAGLKGSSVQVDMKSNLPLEKAVIHLSEKAVDMDIAGRSATGAFPLEQEDEFLIRFLDTRGIANNQPIPYHVNIIPDQIPELKVVVPEDDIQIPGSQKVPFHLDIEDDFGFSALQIGYEIHRPEFLGIEPVSAIYTVKDLVKDDPAQTIQSTWDLTGINLMPEDEVHFHFELYDNDTVSGPKKSISRSFTASVPSLASLYDEFEAEEETVLEDLTLTVEEIQALKEALEASELQLLKSEDLNWEDRQQAERILESVQEQLSELKDLESAISGLSEMGKDQALFSPELLEKFETLRSLVNELMTEEILPDLRRLQEALDGLDPTDIQSAMEKVRKNLDHLEQELDRFIDIFKRVQAEQKMEELYNRMTQLMKQQGLLEERVRKLEFDSDQQHFNQLVREETWNQEEFNRLMDDIRSAGKDIQPYSPDTRDALDQLSGSGTAREAEADMKRVIRDLKRRYLDGGRRYSYSALEHLETMKNALGRIRENFRNETAAAMAGDLRKVMRQALVVSKEQEGLLLTSRDIPRNSPRFRDLAAQQQMIQKQMNVLTRSLVKLSRKTFAVTPGIGKALGTAFAHMEEAKLALAGLQGSQAVESGQEALTAINTVVLMLNQASKTMENSGSASGFEQFLQQMEALSAEQQGINSESMQLALGQMAASLQRSMLERLLARQKQVRKSLQKLIDETAESGSQPLGDLGNITESMDRVIRDMSSGNVTRSTVRRQQQILSRMLDSQKSLTRRGEEKERVSRPADDYTAGSGPGGLPDNRGQRRSLTMEALNRSLKAGYPADYQEMIKRYFHALATTDIPGDGASDTTISVPLIDDHGVEDE